jgi:polysaccharide export outer membrane protein
MGSKGRFFSRVFAALVVAAVIAGAGFAYAQERPAASVTDYVVGPQDVLTITSYDQADLSGKFTLEADGTFTFPLIGRVKAGGLTLRALEEALKKRLIEDGYFKNPQITVSVETYKSQKIYVVGEVRAPGAYPLSGDMNLVEAIARAGSTLPSASGEAIIVHPVAAGASGPTLPNQDTAAKTERIDLRAMQNGVYTQTTILRDGDTIFVPRAESVYVFGQVKNPGAYALQQKDTSVLQALSLAGGITDRGATTRIRIVRMVGSEKKELKVKLSDPVLPGDTIIVAERIF